MNQNVQLCSCCTTLVHFDRVPLRQCKFDSILQSNQLTVNTVGLNTHTISTPTHPHNTHTIMETNQILCWSVDRGIPSEIRYHCPPVHSTTERQHDQDDALCSSLVWALLIIARVKSRCLNRCLNKVDVQHYSSCKRCLPPRLPRRGTFEGCWCQEALSERRVVRTKGLTGQESIRTNRETMLAKWCIVAWWHARSRINESRNT